MTLHDLLQQALQHHQSGRLLEAETLYRQALNLDPTHPDARRLLAVLRSQTGRDLMQKGLLQPALASFRDAVRYAPDSPEALTDLTNALFESGDLEAALAAHRRVADLLPGNPQVRANLAATLAATGRLDEAIALLTQSLAQQPDSVETMINLGSARHFSAGHFQQAADLYSAAVAAKPDDPSANWNLGLALLLQGDYEHGWARFQYRWKLPRFRGLIHANQPLWDGRDLAGRRILLRAEQGYGDSIQFIRYLPEVIRRGGRIILACQQELHRLFQDMGHPVDEWVAPTQPLPTFDAYAPLMSPPTIFNTTLASIPATVPYLRPDPAKSAHWKNRLASVPRLKIGLAWAGKVRPDPRRTIPLSELVPLAQISRAAFFSLQKPGVPAASATSPFHLTDWTPELTDFSDSAALIHNLDLVITIDTAVAHLAGALGKPTWLLLPYVPDWRWMLNRTDSPWYPTMKLLRAKFTPAIGVRRCSRF